MIALDRVVWRSAGLGLGLALVGCVSPTDGTEDTNATAETVAELKEEKAGEAPEKAGEAPEKAAGEEQEGAPVKGLPRIEKGPPEAKPLEPGVLPGTEEPSFGKLPGTEQLPGVEKDEGAAVTSAPDESSPDESNVGSTTAPLVAVTPGYGYGPGGTYAYGPGAVIPGPGPGGAVVVPGGVVAPGVVVPGGGVVIGSGYGGYGSSYGSGYQVYRSESYGRACDLFGCVYW